MKKFGLIGLIVTALCCFTPLLVISFGLIGLSGWLAYADYILLPMLAMFAAITLLAFLRRNRANK